MLDLIEAHPLLTTLVGGTILGIAGYILKRLLDPKTSGKKQTVKQSSIGRDLQQADVILNQPSFKNFGHTGESVHFSKIPLNPSIKEVSEVMNGGFSSTHVNFQVRLKSETDLELKEAYLVYKEKKIHCKPRERKLQQVTNNSLLFDPTDLPFIPDVIFHLKMKVCDYYDHCCELTHELQMKQFPHKDFSGKNSGRWEIHPISIFKIRNCVIQAGNHQDTEMERAIEDWNDWKKDENDRVAKELQEAVNDINRRGMTINDGPYKQKADQIMEGHKKNVAKQQKMVRRELEDLGHSQKEIDEMLE